MADDRFVIRAEDPLTLALREVKVQVPVGLQRVELDAWHDDEGWIRRGVDTLVLRLRALVLAEELDPVTVPVHEERLERKTITVRRKIETPATRWDALKLAFGVPAHRVEWLEASYVEELEVFLPVVCDHEVVLDRELHFPEAALTLPRPEILGHAVRWAEVRPQ